MKTLRIREEVRYLGEDNGWATVRVTKSEGQGMIEDGVIWHVPISSIPRFLRVRGRTFVLLQESHVPELPQEMKDLGKYPPVYTIV